MSGVKRDPPLVYERGREGGEGGLRTKGKGRMCEGGLRTREKGGVEG